MYHEQFSISNFQFSKRKEDKKLVTKLQKTIQKVTHDIEKIKMNTAIAAMMEFLNDWEAVVNFQFPISNFQSSSNDQNPNKKNTVLSVDRAKDFLKILSPFAPHMTEEIWRNVFGEKESIHLSNWPTITDKI